MLSFNPDFTANAEKNQQQSNFNFNNALQQSVPTIPVGTICAVRMSLKPGGLGEGGWLRASATSDVKMLDCEFTVIQGPYEGRKIRQFLTVSGGRTDKNGVSIAAEISRSLIRGMLESARGIDPNDTSAQAQAARCINGWGDLSGLSFLARIGVESDKQGHYPPRNRIVRAITPGDVSYKPLGNTIAY